MSRSPRPSALGLPVMNVEKRILRAFLACTHTRQTRTQKSRAHYTHPRTSTRTRARARMRASCKIHHHCIHSFSPSPENIRARSHAGKPNIVLYAAQPRRLKKLSEGPVSASSRGAAIAERVGESEAERSRAKQSACRRCERATDSRRRQRWRLRSRAHPRGRAVAFRV